MTFARLVSIDKDKKMQQRKTKELLTSIGSSRVGINDVLEGPEFRELSSILKRYLSESYKRGRKDTISKFVKVANDDTLLQPLEDHNKLHRAPRGAARAFIDRVIFGLDMDKGLTFDQIKKEANCEVEMVVSASALRAELIKGEKENRYRRNGGLWFNNKK